MSPSPEIKYIVLSDLHLGEMDSIFTPLDQEAPELISNFSTCMRSLLDWCNSSDQPCLILNGDILGLSFSNYQSSLSLFKEFVHSFGIKENICKEIKYIPGNHDHHIWQLARESDFKNKLKAHRNSDNFPQIINATKPVLTEGIPSEFFESFFHNDETNLSSIEVIYPNLILTPKATNQPYIHITHGHFAEETYSFVSNAMKVLYPELPPPQTIADLSYQNGAFIDFLFSMLGRSGDAGHKFDKLMSTLSSEKKLNKNIQQLADNVALELDFPYLPFHWMEKYLSKRLIANIAEKVRSERYDASELCSDETIGGLLHYFETYCLDGMKDADWDDQPVTFIWGHTHKPFEKYFNSNTYGEMLVLNSGGYVIPFEPMPLIGASIIFISDENEAVSLRLFNDSKNNGEMTFNISLPENQEPTRFANKIKSAIRNDKGELNKHWNIFKLALETEIHKRRNQDD